MQLRWRPEPKKGEYGHGFPGILDTIKDDKLPLSGRWEEHAIMSIWQQLAHRISYSTNSTAFFTSLII